MTGRLIVLALLCAAGASAAAQGGEVTGSLTANGRSAALKHAVAVEVDSESEKGYLDVIIVLSDRPISARDARDAERLERMVRRDGLAALAVRINPDAKVLSASPLHPAFTTLISSGVFVQWKPSAFDENRIAGRFWTDGTQSAFGQQWSYDLTFSAPIELDPGASTVPAK